MPTTTADILDELTGLRTIQNAIVERLDGIEKETKATTRRLNEFEKDVKARFDALDAAVAEVKDLIVSLPPVEFRSGELDLTGGIQTRPAAPDDD